MQAYIKTTSGGKTYETPISDLVFDNSGKLKFFTMHYADGARYLHLYQSHSLPEIADDLFRGVLNARSVKGLFSDISKKAGRLGWVIGSAVALADFLKKNNNFSEEGYYDSEGHLLITGVYQEKMIIYK
ncbi:MAG: hypothetical protein MUE81_24305 [Thermoflexibacter sp.]|jgi:hypothetical protein|nr:hypothetical protein [Thermoflexibacter sp.]